MTSPFKTISRIFSKNSGSTQDAPKTEHHADDGLVVRERERGGPVTRFLLPHGGAYDHKYYRADEARHAAGLAAAKFLSVSFATFSFMKAVHPAFDAINPDIRGYFTALAAGGMWWGISKLDTEVLHAMRAQRAAQEAKPHLDKMNISEPKAPPAWPGAAFRIGISLGSLGISLPALMIATTQVSVNESILQNAPAMREHHEMLDTTKSSITALRTRLGDLRQQLTITQSPDGALTTEDRARIAQLTAAAQQAAEDKRRQQQDYDEAIKKRDEAVSRTVQEDMGIRGSVRGRSTLYFTAIADKQDAERDMARIRASMDRLQGTMDSATTEMARIRAQNSNGDNTLRTRSVTLARTIESQITQVNDDLGKQVARQKELENLDNISPNDPRYNALHPDMAKQGAAYLTYMSSASPFEWSRQIFLGVMIVALELGVFAAATSRKANTGEIRGYLAEALNTREAAEKFRREIELIALKGESDSDNEKIALGKKAAITRADLDQFKVELDKAINDPERLERMAEEIQVTLEALRMNRQKKPGDGKSPFTPTPAPV